MIPTQAGPIGCSLLLGDPPRSGRRLHFSQLPGCQRQQPPRGPWSGHCGPTSMSLLICSRNSLVSFHTTGTNSRVQLTYLWGLLQEHSILFKHIRGVALFRVWFYRRGKTSPLLSWVLWLDLRIKLS